MNHLIEFIDQYKTKASKKAALTRELKLTKEYLANLEISYKNRQNKYFGFHLGDMIFKHTIQREKDVIDAITKLYNSL